LYISTLYTSQKSYLNDRQKHNSVYNSIISLPAFAATGMNISRKKNLPPNRPSPNLAKELATLS